MYMYRLYNELRGYRIYTTKGVRDLELQYGLTCILDVPHQRISKSLPPRRMKCCVKGEWQNLPSTSYSYHMATRALANLSPEGDKLAKRPRGHVMTGLLQIARDGLRSNLLRRRINSPNERDRRYYRNQRKPFFVR